MACGRRAAGSGDSAPRLDPLGGDRLGMGPGNVRAGDGVWSNDRLRDLAGVDLVGVLVCTGGKYHHDLQPVFSNGTLSGGGLPDLATAGVDVRIPGGVCHYSSSADDHWSRAGRLPVAGTLDRRAERDGGDPILALGFESLHQRVELVISSCSCGGQPTPNL